MNKILSAVAVLMALTLSACASSDKVPAEAITPAPVETAAAAPAVDAKVEGCAHEGHDHNHDHSGKDGKHEHKCENCAKSEAAFEKAKAAKAAKAGKVAKKTTATTINTTADSK